MHKFPFGWNARHTCALLASMLVVACGNDLSDRSTRGGDGTDVTDGADVADAVGVNPERSPELWFPPVTVSSTDTASAAESPPEVVVPEKETPPAARPPAARPPAARPPTRPAPTTGGGSSAKTLAFRGINLSGAEFGTALPGVFGRDYTFSKPSEVDYYLSKGFNTFRIGFKWERMQRVAYGELDETYLGRLDELVRYTTARGATVILNPHNFARYYGVPVGTREVPTGVFADFWRRMAIQYSNNDRVMFNLVNEPHDMPTEQWVAAANDAIAKIRLASADNVIVVPGNAWTGAHAWTKSDYGTPNAVALLDIVDPADRVLFEVHQYLDDDSSGGSGTCVSETIGSERMKAFVDWLRVNHRKGFLGEFAGGNNPRCRAAVEDMLEFVRASADVITGWAWWAGGPWWGDYKFTLHPNGGDRPQLAFIAPFLRD